MKIVRPFLSWLLIGTGLLVVHCVKTSSNQYSGTPFSDTVYSGGTQIIPGKLQCEYYDFGGEGVAFHDADSINSGSGGLNPADGSYLHEFRIHEAVDISYTKIDTNKIDNNPYNLVQPEKDQLYVGWTEPGEWLKYTVRVEEPGVHTVGLMYTSNCGGVISLSCDDTDLTGPINIPTTFVKEDLLQWRQWHHWNYIESIAEVKFTKGVHVLTLTTVAEGNMNYDFLMFTLKSKK